MKVYLLWYTSNEHSKPIIVCALRDYYKAEKVADNLHFQLSMDNSSIHTIGITRTLMNKIHLDVFESDCTWIVYKNNQWFLDEDTNA